MKNHWAKEFYVLAESQDLSCELIQQINGWFETFTVEGKICFTKSFTYDMSKRQYFQGVDPKKLYETGDLILLCGGTQGKLRDIFIIPWEVFFKTLKNGKPINTYKPPKEYLQYKFHIRNRKWRWIMSVQGGQRPILDITKYQYDEVGALAFFK